MAKKKRIVKEQAEEEDYEFVPPEFDEKEFILKDIYGTKVLIVVAVMAVIIGVLCSCLQRMSDSYGLYLGLLLLFLAAFVQKKLLSLLGFKPEYLETKTMIGNYIMFILLGLGVWILMVNPPFM